MSVHLKLLMYTCTGMYKHKVYVLTVKIFSHICHCKRQDGKTLTSGKPFLSSLQLTYICTSI